MIKRFLLAIVLLATAAGASHASVVLVPIFIPQPDAAPADYRNIHTVAVISALGTRLDFSINHLIAVAHQAQDITGWGVDDEIAARLKQYLSGRFTFRDVPYDRAALAQVGRLDGSGLAAFLQALPAKDVDAFLVVRPDRERGAPGVAGLALENGGPMGAPTAPILWANYEIDVIDAHSAKIIGRAYSRLRLRDKTPASYAGIAMNDTLKVHDDFKLSDVQSTILRANLSFLIHISLVETLRALQLGADLPPPGARVLSPIPPAKDPYKAYKTVAVVSALGNQFELEREATLFSRERYAIPVPGWQLDRMVEQRARAALSKHFTVVDAPVDRAAFAQASMWDNDGKLAPNFTGLTPDPGIDLYIAILKLNKPVWGMASASGVGVFRGGSPDGEIATAFAHFVVVAIDARTMKFVTAMSGITSPDRPQPDPEQEIDKVLWPKSPAAPTPGEIAKLQGPIMDILDDGVDETLLQLALLGVIPTDAPLPSSVAAQP